MNSLCAITLSLPLSLAGIGAVQTEKDAARIQQDVKALIHAPYDGDVETVVRYTHPRVIAMQGGIERTRAVVQEVVLKMKGAGMRIESLAFPKPPEFLEGGGRRFAVVPTLSIISVNGQRFESLNFQLGVLEAGAEDWVYVEGSRLTKANVQALFPGFPAGHEFPPIYRRELQPKPPAEQGPQIPVEPVD